MITLCDRRTGDLFDRRSELGEKRRRLLERSWAEVFRNHLLEDLPVDELFPYFDARIGRPSKDFHIVISVLLLQQLHDLSDAATVEALAFNMTWHHALDVHFEGPCCTDQLQLRARPTRDGIQAVRSKLGWPSPVIRLRTRTPILASVF